MVNKNNPPLGGPGRPNFFGPGNQPNQQQPQKEQVFQMLWDCRFCGTKKLLGIEHRHCPNCGAAQDPAWRYFPTDEDKKIVSDPKYAYAGIDKACPFCKQPNSANAKFCVACGGDLEKAAQVELKDAKTASGKAEDLTLKKFQQQQAAIAAQNKGMPTWLKIVIIVAVIAGIIGGALFFLSRSTYASQIKVADANWERTVQVVEYQAQPGDTWCDAMPGGAYNVIRRAGTDYRSVREACGSHTEKVDRGDGSFSERTVTDYCDKQVPYSRDKCTYVVNRWNQVDMLKTSGGANDTPIWPNFTPNRGGTDVIGSRKQGNTTQTYRVIFDRADNKGKITFMPTTFEEWQKFRVGQRYSVEIDRLENVHWNTLKTAD